MNTVLEKLLEYLLTEEELEEQNALGGGGVGATSSGLALNLSDFRPPPQSKLEEVNTVYNGSGLSFSDISHDMDASQNQGDLTGENEKKSPTKKKNKKDYNPNHDTMWNYGDKPTGDLPAMHVKYIALEEHVSLKKKTDRVRIFQDKGHPIKQDSLNVLIDFLKFCNRILKMEDMPDIYLHTIKKPDMTTGMYNRSEHVIHVLVGKRLLVDVLRTIAHELTHARQEETGLLDKHLANVDPMNEMGDIDTIYENEAYTLAGNIVKIFCRKYKRISKDDLYQLNENKRYL